MKKEIGMPVVIGVVALLVAFVGFLVYRGATGDMQGDGKTNNVEASPPMPVSARANHVGTAP